MFDFQHLDGRFVYRATAVHLPGEVVTRPDGTLAVFDGMQGCVVGEAISPDPLDVGKTAIVLKVPANTFIAGADVFWNATAKQATSVATGNRRIGRAIEAYAAGTTEMHVNLGG